MFADDDDRDNFGGGLSLVGEAGGKESDDEKRKKERKGKGGPGDEEPPPLYSIHHAKVYVILLACSIFARLFEFNRLVLSVSFLGFCDMVSCRKTMCFYGKRIVTRFTNVCYQSRKS